MTNESETDDDRALDAAFAALPEPELPDALRKRLAAIPERGNVRRFPGRSWRASAFGWAAAAAIGLFVGATTVDQESTETASLDVPAEAAADPTDDEDEMLALAMGSVRGFEEEP